MSEPSGAGKIRHEWYQTPTELVLSIFIRSLSKDGSNLSLTFTPRAFSLSLPSAHSPTNTEIAFDLEPLAHEIVVPKDGISPSGDPVAVKPKEVGPDLSKGDKLESWYRILTPKIEVHLIKAQSNLKWGKLEGEEESLAQMAAREREEAAVRRGESGSYPTSSKKKTDWDKVAADVKKEEAAGPDKNDPNGGGDTELNRAFQQLYAGASDDARQAMMKSYVESNGTALSTNWDEVKVKRTETRPPDGMIAKKWNE